MAKDKEKEEKEERLPVVRRPGVVGPFDMWRDMHRTFSDFMTNFDEFFWTPRMLSPAWGWFAGPREPYLDLVDEGKAFKLTVELPGISKENVEINVTDRGIEISAEAKEEKEKKREGYIMQERGYSRFYRRLAFPAEVLPDDATASFRDGVLEITVPKKVATPALKSRKVEIE